MAKVVGTTGLTAARGATFLRVRSLRSLFACAFAPGQANRFAGSNPVGGERFPPMAKVVGTTGLTAARGATFLRVRSLRSPFACAFAPGQANRFAGSNPVGWERFPPMAKVVGTTGFEPATPTPPVWCATRLRYVPSLSPAKRPEEKCDRKSGFCKWLVVQKN